ncbi:hypothetical protein EJD97_013762 [Solanum chilense]|uniref:Uncharacterized protein n=1 Tax=Solanum chilense TaxID=4083 RepID=A0A6N2BB51_SOLCI|nr:hypothetical protein EJD97_013762 [Solanum chilense]
MARASEKRGSLHTGGAISLVTRKERMEKEFGRHVAVEEMFKDTHVKKSTNPGEEERWIEPLAQETYIADVADRESKREVDIAASKEAENKSDDGVDQEGDKNDKGDKESEGDKE